jgi:hypothetical protein
MNMSGRSHEVLEQISLKRLQKTVKKTEGLRHGWENFDALENRAAFGILW